MKDSDRNQTTNDTAGIADTTMLQQLAENPSQFDAYTTRAIAEAALRRIARLEGYIDGLRHQLTAVRLAAGCNHD